MPTASAFDALNLWDGGGYVPPDTSLGVGVSAATANPANTSYVIEAVNSIGGLYDMSSGALVGYLNTSACTTSPSTDSVTDPRVLYDASSGYWFISTATFSPIGDASWNLLYTNDPTASYWNCLIISTSNIGSGNFPDFPKMGISADKVVLTGDAFAPAGHNPFSQSYKFVGTEFVVINKADLLSGTVYQSDFALFAPDQGDFAIEPAQELGTAPSNLYMAAVNSGLSSTSTLDVWKITGVPSASTTVQSSVTSLPIYTISIPPNAQQRNTSTLIDTNDDSLLDAVYREDASGAGSLWVSANDACTPPGDTANAVRSCLRFINVSIDASGTPTGTPQDFDYGDPTMYYYYPAVRADAAGDLFASFSGSSSNEYASAYAGLATADSSDKLTNLSVTHAGTTAYILSPPRWGDYSGASVDPSGNSVWLGAEYATPDPLGLFSSIWGTAITQVTP